MFRIIFLLPLTVVLLGQQSPAGAQQTEKKGSISGVILNAVTKEPVRKAEVTLLQRGSMQGGPMGNLPMAPGGIVPGGQIGPGGPQGRPSMAGGGQGQNRRGSRTATTDTDGKFTFTDVDAGSYNLSARRTGLIDTRYGSRTLTGAGTSISVSNGQEVTNIRVEMMPQGVVAGRVLDEEGDPLQGVQIQLVDAKSSSRLPQMGRGMRGFGGMSRTDDRGEFRVANVSPGKYLLQVTPTQVGGMFSEVTGSRSYVTTYFPGVYDSASAEKITVAAGAELSGFQIRLQKTEVYRVQGTLQTPDGQTPRGYSVFLLPKGAVTTAVMGSFRRQDDTGFEVRNVLPGSYTLVARTQNGPRNFLVHRENLEVGSGDVNNLSIRMATPLTISGQVLVGKDAGGVSPSNMRIALQPVDGPGGSTAQAKEDGTFVLENVSAGSYRLQVTLPSGSAYLESVKLGEQDITGREFEISSAAPLRIQIDGNGGTVNGTITSDGNPALGSTILLLPVKKELREVPYLKMATTDQNGSFTVSNIAPGDYLVVGVDEYDESMLDDDVQIQTLERKASKVSLKKGGSESVTLELIRTDS